MVSICYCFIESLSGLVMARSACNQSHLFICSPPPFSLFFPSLSQIHSADSHFVSFPSSSPLPPLNLFLFFSVGITYKRLWKSDMCGADLRTDNLLFPPTLPSPHTRENSPTCQRKGEEKFMFEKKKKNPNLELVWTHPCVIIYFQCRVPGISALEWGVEIESFSAVLRGQVLFGKNPLTYLWLKEPLNGIIASRGEKWRPGAARETPEFQQPLAFCIWALPSCLFQSLTPVSLFPRLLYTPPLPLLLSVTDILNRLLWTEALLCFFSFIIILLRPSACSQTWVDCE